MPFPDSYPVYPTHRQFIDYLEHYAAAFEIKPEFNTTVQSATTSSSSGSGDVVMQYIGRWLVAATGENAETVVPDIPGLEGFQGKVTHVSDYKSSEAYRGQRVLVVGCGNSGMEVSLDLCDHGACPARVVRDAVHVLPREVLGKSTFELAVLLMRWLPLWLADKIMILLAWLVLGDLTRLRMGRPGDGPLELKETHGRTPVLDYGALTRIRVGDIDVVTTVKSFGKGAQIELAGGHVLTFDSIVVATGFRSNVAQWLPVNDLFNKDGYPKTAFPHGWKGQSGLYAVGFIRCGLSGTSADAVCIARTSATSGGRRPSPPRGPEHATGGASQAL
ncbi:hypothetical protein U9M48_030754 [Paspalum notatum var. saurae]|uniref:Flavin-containing monooxygenase n=1 Tax=Paspalum notatum var. saurae TaxID=547442 RepID=A0AAQ3U1B7_PASNO